jgi:ABC-type glutathione transport system ATPase component
VSHDPQPILSVRDLRVRFPVRSGLLQRETGAIAAVDGVSFDMAHGETLGLVGESGSGKSTVGRAILRLLDRFTTGSVRFEGRDLLAMRGGELHEARRKIQIVFQDPSGAMNPRMRVWRIVSEPLTVHGVASGSSALRARSAALLDLCGMPASSADRYPHEFSGGQRQRIVIARALALNPSLLICDEPTSALDVSVQAQILNLLKDLQRELSLSYLFISHDMAVVAHMCDRIAVMQRGRIVELGSRDKVLKDPSDEYTKRLLAAVPEASTAPV